MILIVIDIFFYFPNDPRIFARKLPCKEILRLKEFLCVTVLPSVWLSTAFLFGRGAVEVDEAHAAVYAVFKVVDALADFGIRDENRVLVHLVATCRVGEAAVDEVFLVEQILHGISRERHPIVTSAECQFVASVNMQYVLYLQCRMAHYLRKRYLPFRHKRSAVVPAHKEIIAPSLALYVTLDKVGESEKSNKLLTLVLVEEVVDIVLGLDWQIHSRELMVILIWPMLKGSAEQVHLRVNLSHVSPSHVISLGSEIQFGMLRLIQIWHCLHLLVDMQEDVIARVIDE